MPYGSFSTTCDVTFGHFFSLMQLCGNSSLQYSRQLAIVVDGEARMFFQICLYPFFDTLYFPKPEDCVFPPVGRRKRKFANENPYLPHE